MHSFKKKHSLSINLAEIQQKTAEIIKRHQKSIYEYNPTISNGLNNEPCKFCKNRSIIIEQLSSLKDAVVTKNEKIKQLEAFILKLSSLIYSSLQSSQSQNKINLIPQILPINYNFTLNITPLVHKQSLSQQNHQSLSQSSILKSQTEHSIDDQSQSLDSSQVKADINKNFKNQIQNLINRQLTDKQMQQMISSQQHVQSISKESSLKNKLLGILNHLPSQKNAPRQNSQLQFFQTLSEPKNEGFIGAVSTRVSNYKIVKHPAFLKKGFEIQQQKKGSNELTQLFVKSRQLLNKYVR